MIEVGNVTASEYDGKHLTIQVDGFGEEDAGVPFGEGRMLNGVMHRPADPELDADGQPKPEASCAAMYWYEGGALHAIAADDPRIHAQMPPVGKGETIIACSDGCFVLLGANGIQFYAPASGKAHVFEMKRGGAIQMRHADGAGVVLDGSKALIHSGGGSTWIELRDDGGTLAGNWSLKGSIQPVVPLTVGAVLISGV